jgi:hypothetical protein
MRGYYSCKYVFLAFLLLNQLLLFLYFMGAFSSDRPEPLPPGILF